MSNHTIRSTRFPLYRRLWKPAVVTGAGATSVVIWFEEIMLYVEEILALVFLPLLAGVIYLLDIFIFKSCMPRREDLDKPNAREESE
jgi:hypothetical protein